MLTVIAPLGDMPISVLAAGLLGCLGMVAWLVRLRGRKP